MASRSNNSLRRGTTPASLPLTSSNLASSSTSNLHDGLYNANGSNNAGASSGASAMAAAPAPHSRTTITVEEWERKAPLSELQLRSVNRLMKMNESERASAIPLKFADEPGTPTPSTSIHLQRLLQKDGSSRPSTPSTPTTQAHTPSHAYRPEHALLHPAHPVQTPQQFYDWFALIDRSVAHSQEAHYRAHVASLEEHLRVCDLLATRIEEVEMEVDRMMEGWRGVEEGGKSLKGACESLLEERDALVELVEDIGGHLEYFQELEHATRMLNYPGESLIFEADFLYMVERVDICIDFLKAHRHYKEAEVYLLRFQQCMTRAMTLIKMNFVGSLRALSSEISRRLSEKDVSPTAQHHLLYTRFKSVSAKVAPLLGELERRAQSYPDELSALLAECHVAYLATRKALLVPRVMEEIRGLDPGRSELVELTREGCGYLKALCRDEWDLYREFFATGEAGLYQYLETLCDLLYDDLRPRILHEPRLTVLCEVCTVLQALMVLDSSTVSSSSSSVSTDSSTSSEVDSDEDDEDDDDSTSPSKPSHSRRHRGRRSDELTIPAATSPTLSASFSQAHSQKPNTARLGKRLHIAHLLKMVLQDAQTRLFFKAQAVIQSEVRHYVPTEEDLRWPGVLVSSASNNGSIELREKESTNQIFQSISALAVQATRDTWYSTLKKTIWVVSQLRDFVQPAIFEDISQEALSYCRLSLIAASELIASRGAPESKLDGALFLVRHLLVLKEVWASLEEVMAKEQGSGSASTAAEKEKEKERRKALGSAGLGSARGLEFAGISASTSGGVTETLTNMLSKTTSLLPEGLFASLGVTRGVESDMRGIKLDIDHSLRKACEDTIAACANPICEPLDTWTAANTSPKPNPTSGLNTSVPPPSAGVPQNADSASQTDLSTLHLRFLEALQRDLRSGVARIRLYLTDDRTVRVLLEHVVERIMGSYELWGEAIGKLGLGGTSGGFGYDARGRSTGQVQGEMEILSSARLREVLRDVCGDPSLSFAGYGRV